MKVEVASSNRVLADSVTRAATLPERMRGLLGRPPLRPGEALVIEPAAQVHTFGMRYSIDVLFCKPDGTVLHVVRALRPHRMTRWVRGAKIAIELPPGAVPEDVRPGDWIIFS